MMCIRGVPKRMEDQIKGHHSSEYLIIMCASVCLEKD